MPVPIRLSLRRPLHRDPELGEVPHPERSGPAPGGRGQHRVPRAGLPGAAPARSRGSPPATSPAPPSTAATAASWFCPIPVGVPLDFVMNGWVNDKRVVAPPDQPIDSMARAASASAFAGSSGSSFMRMLVSIRNRMAHPGTDLRCAVSHSQAVLVNIEEFRPRANELGA